MTLLLSHTTPAQQVTFLHVTANSFCNSRFPVSYPNSFGSSPQPDSGPYIASSVQQHCGLSLGDCLMLLFGQHNSWIGFSICHSWVGHHPF
jgi:hypothetical protein